jgi:undecaprenyl-diphosphatase
VRGREEEPALSCRHALVLGLLQGPTELLPVSSSGHIELIPWLAGWPYAELNAELRKTVEVALHAGAAAALAVHMQRQLLRDAAGMRPGRAVVVALSLAPPALAGLLLGRPIERRLGGPRSIAAGLSLGALAMALADARPGAARSWSDATARDGMALGIAQASALIPGVSRNGATLAAARARGFSRSAAQRLSWHAGLPVILGASVLTATRRRPASLARGERAALAAGTGAAFVSTLASARLLDRGLRDGRSLLPSALYRCLLAAAVVLRLARSGHHERPTNS